MTISPAIRPGDVLTRDEIYAVFGGSRQGGICPSVEHKRVMLFSDPQVAEQYGYHHDGWLAEEDSLGPIFEYTGAGPSGDQKFVGNGGPAGNRAVLTHVQDGRTLEVFVREGKAPNSNAKTHRYLGSFAVDEEQPYVPRQSKGADGELRTAIVFRLRPVENIEPSARDAIAPATYTAAEFVRRAVTIDMLQSAAVTNGEFVAPDLQNADNYAALNLAAEGKLVPVRATKTTQFSRAASAATQVRLRKAKLVESFVKVLESQGHSVGSFQLRIEGRTSTLRTDFFDATDNVLYEAQGSSDRDSIRTALARLLDYRRYVRHEAHDDMPKAVILLPERPEDSDMLPLLAQHDTSLVYQTGSSFVTATVDGAQPLRYGNHS